MGFATSTIKFLAFILNILCCIFGALTLSASAYALANFIDSNAIHVPCIIGIVLGSLLFLTTLLGCCGALRESIRLTWIYATILLMLLAAQIAVIFLLAVDFKELAVEAINHAWNENLHGSAAMAGYEIKYQCCGKTSADDYIQSGQKIPRSCYKTENSTNSADIYNVGCISKLEEAFTLGANVEEISDWSLVGVEAFTILCACMLAINLRNKKRRERF